MGVSSYMYTVESQTVREREREREREKREREKSEEGTVGVNSYIYSRDFKVVKK